MWIITIIALTGTILNIKHRKECFILWLVSNVAFCIRNFIIGEYPQSALFAIYAMLSVYGLWEWSKQK